MVGIESVARVVAVQDLVSLEQQAEAGAELSVKIDLWYLGKFNESLR